MEATMAARVIAISTAAAFLLPAPALAQYLPQNDPAPGASSLMSSNFSSAEREIRGADVSRYDPARSINLGIAFAKTGQVEKAQREFNQVLREDDVQLVVANGRSYSSHEVAQRALDAMHGGVLSQ
jgi:Flp pilus assembly protein TadD